MSRIGLYAVSALFLALPSLATAQTAEPAAASENAAEPRTLTDVRIEVVKQALELTPEQAKYWPTIEEAIRQRADFRRQRLEKLSARASGGGERDRDIVTIMQNRAEVLAERSANLKKLADAWQPLYPTLSDDQKRRMRVLAALVVHGVREGIEQRRMEREDEEAWAGSAAGETGSGRE